MKNIFKKIGVPSLFFIGVCVFSQCGAWTSVHAYSVEYTGTTPVNSTWNTSTHTLTTTASLSDWSGSGEYFPYYIGSHTFSFGGCGTPCSGSVSPSTPTTTDFKTTGVIMSGAALYSYAVTFDSYTGSDSCHSGAGYCTIAWSDSGQFDTSAFPAVFIHGSIILFDVTSSGVISAHNVVPLSTTSRIENISPAEGDVAGSTSVPISFDYYFNSSELPHPVDSIDMVLDRTDAPEAQIKFNVTPITMDILETGVSHTFTLTSDATYHLTFNINARNYAGVEVSVPMSGIYSDFSVVSDPVTSAYATCDITSLAGCFQNVFTYLFRPSNSSVSAFQSLTLQGKFPFSYVYDMGTVYNELFANTGSMSYSVSVNTGALGTISFISASQISAVPFASTIKTLLGYLLYFFTALTLYRMLLRTHDK
jgi:hypothetical protein